MCRISFFHPRSLDMKATAQEMFLLFPLFNVIPKSISVATRLKLCKKLVSIQQRSNNYANINRGKIDKVIFKFDTSVTV